MGGVLERIIQLRLQRVFPAHVQACWQTSVYKANVKEKTGYFTQIQGLNTIPMEEGAFH